MNIKPIKINQIDHIIRVDMQIDASKEYQIIDGFGMNINPQHWENDRLIPIMDLLHKDLAASIYRLDVYGQSNWIDPNSEYNASILNEDTYKKIYTNTAFQNTWAMCRYLNKNGIKPYLNASGVVPGWMCESDQVTLKDYESFSVMMASMLHWARHKEGIEFELFGPLNETDMGPPEGPFVSGVEYTVCMEILVKVLEKWGLADIQLVVAEQAEFNSTYVKPLLASRELQGKIAVIGMHSYWSRPVGEIAIEIANYNGVQKPRFWMTEYGDLDSTGEREWDVAWISAKTLVSYLNDGAQAGLVWDAFDNYHDHDKAWSLYGLLRRGHHEYTPKKRYYAAKQVYRFVRPNSQRIEILLSNEAVQAVAVFHQQYGLTVTGVCESTTPVELHIKGLGLSAQQLKGYITTEQLNCAYMGNFCKEGDKWIIHLPANSIFTFTQTELIDG